jgi:D-amino-acid dehydrogenase
MRIIIIGAGIVGLASAWSLASDGHAVTVIDRNEGPGEGTSFANGSQLAYSYVAPMAAPSVLRALPKYLLDRDSPIRFRPAADPGQWVWLARFLRACNGRAVERATARLLALSSLSRETMDAMIAATGVEFRHHRNGKLVVQSDAASQRDAEAQMRLQARMGCEQQALTASECVDLEPGLAAISGRLAGGIYTPSEEVGDCLMLCQGLHATLSGPPWNVAFRLGTTVERILLEGGRVTGVQTEAGVLDADLYVLAAGMQSRALGRALGLDLPLQAVRGYSITARMRDGNRGPVRSITDTAHKVVFAPVGDTLRIAGFAEIDRPVPELRPARVQTLVAELQAMFPGLCDTAEVAPWSGLRPATPDGVPVIGRSRVENLLLNLGHGGLGLTLATGSARLLADVVAGRQPQVREADYTL